jgi:hypothetical protein
MNICPLLRAAENGNALMYEMLKIVKAIDEDSFHVCPYNFIEMKNKPFKIDSLPSIFSQGDYRVFVNISNRHYEDYVAIELLISWFSSERNSFG